MGEVLASCGDALKRAALPPARTAGAWRTCDDPPTVHVGSPKRCDECANGSADCVVEGGTDMFTLLPLPHRRAQPSTLSLLLLFLRGSSALSSPSTPSQPS